MTAHYSLLTTQDERGTQWQGRNATEMAIIKIKDKDTRKLEEVVAAVEMAVRGMDQPTAKTASVYLGIRAPSSIGKEDVIQKIKESLYGTTAGR